jgi:heme exporter protein A
MVRDESLAKFEPSGNANPPPPQAAAVQAIAAEGLACRRGSHIVVSGLSFEARAGMALILRGPNGSGKTTLLRTIAGFLPPAAGRIEIKRDDYARPPHPSPLPKGRRDGRNSLSQPYPRADMATLYGKLALASLLAEGQDEGVFHYIGHANAIKPRLSVIENISFWQRYYSGTGDIEAAEAALEAFGLLRLADFNAGHLSQGQARRLGLARLLAAQRPIWLLDEPSVSLDAASTRLLEQAIATHLAAGGLVIASTHLDLAIPEAAVLELGRAPHLQ